MWRNLFVARMKLSAHLAPREVPAYALVVERSDGRLGSQLRPAVLDCGQAGTQPPRPGVDVWPDAEKRCDVTSGSGRMVSGSAALDQFANMLFAWAGRLVINATKLTGRFSIDLRFSIPARQFTEDDVISMELFRGRDGRVRWTFTRGTLDGTVSRKASLNYGAMK